MKTPRTEKNPAGGYDLLCERDLGLVPMNNMVHILTGAPEFSRKFWEEMQILSIDALAGMDLGEEGSDGSNQV